MLVAKGAFECVPGGRGVTAEGRGMIASRPVLRSAAVRTRQRCGAAREVPSVAGGRCSAQVGSGMFIGTKIENRRPIAIK